jgi:hypothetical protein
MHRLASQLQRYLSSTGKNILPLLEVKKDKYNGVHITPREEIEGSAFNQYMADLLRTSSSNGTTSIWVHLNGRQIALVSDLVNDHHFVFHRGAAKSMSLYRWILPDRKDMVVPYSMFHVGCGGVIIHDNSILLIEEKRVHERLCRASLREDLACLEGGLTLGRESKNAQREKSSKKLE